jgi:hypothetical protein
MNEFVGKSTAELLTLHAEIMEELRTRNVSAAPIIRQAAWQLFCAAFKWDQASNSVKGYV